MSLDLADGISTMVQVMAWCHQATSHYQSQCWPRFMSPHGITRPPWVNKSTLEWVTPLGQPRSVYKSDISCCFPEFRVEIVKWPQRSRSMTFSITAERIPGCLFGANFVIVTQIHYELSCRQSKFPIILSHSSQNDLEDQGQRPSWVYHRMHVLCKFGDSSSILRQVIM